MKRRKADDEYLIRKALLDARLIDAVISLPLNVFYGAGVPACLLILRKQRPTERRDQILLIYAARHYRELSAQNELRPQDVMRILVHCQAYGDGTKVPALTAEHSRRIHKQIDMREDDEPGRLYAEYQMHADRQVYLDAEIDAGRAKLNVAKTKGERAPAEAAIAKLEKLRDKTIAKLAERDDRIAEARQRAENDRQDVAKVCDELGALYAEPDELLKHARVVSLDEVEENEFNLNIPRYVDTYVPEPRVDVKSALKELAKTEKAVQDAQSTLSVLLREIGYEAD
jgi:type I restriction enzyme M protein